MRLINLLWDCEINEVSLVSLSENTELIAIPRAGRVQSHVKWKQGRMRNCLGEPHSVAVAYEDCLDYELGRAFGQPDAACPRNEDTLLPAFSESTPLNH